MTKHEKTPAEDTIKGEHQPYEEEEATGGAPHGYDANQKRYDEDGNPVYRKEAEDAPSNLENEKD